MSGCLHVLDDDEEENEKDDYENENGDLHENVI